MTVSQEGTVYFPIIFHFHQPCGNFPWVIEDAYQKAYLPLLNIISKYPRIRTNLHYSGPLLLWLKKNHPEYLDQLSMLIKKNQIEIIGGGFYEPIMAIIPEEDRRRQIQLMIDWWEKNLGINTKGAWLAERVWVPDLPRTLYDMNIDFIFIDDYLFRIAGYSEEETFYVYLTEVEGKTVVVLPINEQIRYLIPWKDPEETIQYLKKGKDYAHEKIIVMFSDAEKMGLWPAGDRTTFDICYVSGYNGQQGWLPEFFEAILENEWIKPILISDYLKKIHPRGLIYLPTSSYDKMSVWALPTPLRKKLENLRHKALHKEIPFARDILTFATGSFWQNFLIKYSQSNIMHKRMMICRKKADFTEKTFPHLQEKIYLKIWNHIMAAQSNDAYWHGLFGGVYYPFLRHSIHKNICQAEHLLDKIWEQEGFKAPTCQIKDVLLDGHPDGVLENRYLSCYISSLVGGAIFSLNLKQRGYNFLNVLTRRKESYHSDEMSTIDDRFEKWMFQDHFLYPTIDKKILQEDRYQDLGNFANNIYKIHQENDNKLSLHRRGMIKLNKNSINTTILKNYRLESSKLLIAYEVDFSEPIKEGSLIFSPEINVIGVSYPYKTKGIINERPFNLDKAIYHQNCQTIEIKDENELEKVSIVIYFSDVIKCYTFPIFSIPKSEHGWQRQYQGTSIFPVININGKKLQFKVQILLTPI